MKFDPERSPVARARRGAEGGAGARNRLIALGLMLLVVVVAMVGAFYQREKLRAEEEALLPEQRGPDAVVALPPFDVAGLAALVRDGSETERVIADEQALAMLLEHARRLTPTHLRALGLRELGPEELAALAAAPAGFRGEPYTARGYVERLLERERQGRAGREHHGTLRLGDGSAVHFVVAELAQRASVGSYLRVDGLFLKLARIETSAGWLEGPLLVGPRALRSFPASERGGRAEDFPREILATVLDDSLHEVVPEPSEAFWELMAHAVALEPDALDWEAAPVLDGQVMGEILDDGAAWRGRPLRLPVVRNQGTWIEDAGENPARVERLTKGWIGSWEWQRGGVLHFVAPFEAPQIERTTTITGRGFFFRNHAYEARDGALCIAPLFVMHSLEVFVPADAPEIRWLAWGIGAVVLTLTALFTVLLRRDRKRSAELQAELVRRRRERRAGGAKHAPGA